MEFGSEMIGEQKSRKWFKFFFHFFFVFQFIFKHNAEQIGAGPDKSSSLSFVCKVKHTISSVLSSIWFGRPVLVYWPSAFWMQLCRLHKKAEEVENVDPKWKQNKLQRLIKEKKKEEEKEEINRTTWTNLIWSLLIVITSYRFFAQNFLHKWIFLFAQFILA